MCLVVGKQKASLSKAQTFEPLRFLGVTARPLAEQMLWGLFTILIFSLVQHYGGLVLVVTWRLQALAVAEISALRVQQNGDVKQHHDGGNHDQVEAVAKVGQSSAVPVLLLVLRKKHVEGKVFVELHQPCPKCHHLGPRSWYISGQEKHHCSAFLGRRGWLQDCGDSGHCAGQKAKASA